MLHRNDKLHGRLIRNGVVVDFQSTSPLAIVFLDPGAEKAAEVVNLLEGNVEGDLDVGDFPLSARATGVVDVLLRGEESVGGDDGLVDDGCEDG